MKLYHGSNIIVQNPIIIDNKRKLDFGKGFYLTSDFEQAKKWAKNTTERRNNGIASVSLYEYNENNNLKILKFEGPTYDWLKFVANNRKNIYYESDYDLIIGPVANDNTMPVLNGYLDGTYDENEAIKRLLTQKLKDQIVFKTEKSLEYLKFMEAETYE